MKYTLMNIILSCVFTFTVYTAFITKQSDALPIVRLQLMCHISVPSCINDMHLSTNLLHSHLRPWKGVLDRK